jgi:hypothetical protein
MPTVAELVWGRTKLKAVPEKPIAATIALARKEGSGASNCRASA